MSATLVDDLHGFLALELDVLLGVEERLATVLPRLGAAATDVQLRAEIERHAVETGQHSRNVETALRAAGVEPAARPPTALAGLESQYTDELAALSAAASVDLRDLALARHGAMVEHLEIAAYESALQKAELLALDDAVELLEANLDDERRMLDAGKSVSHRLASALAREHLRA